MDFSANQAKTIALTISESDDPPIIPLLMIRRIGKPLSNEEKYKEAVRIAAKRSSMLSIIFEAEIGKKIARWPGGKLAGLVGLHRILGEEEDGE